MIFFRKPVSTFRDHALALCLVLILVGGGAGAAPLSLYQDEAQARVHCAGDAVVWLDFHTRRYYAAGQARYGQGRHGVFTGRTQARRNGYRRSIFGRR